MITNSDLGQRQNSWAWTGLHCSEVPLDLAFPLLGSHAPNPNSLSMGTWEVEQEITAVTRTNSLALPSQSAVSCSSCGCRSHLNAHNLNAHKWSKSISVAKAEISHLSVTTWFQKGSYPLTCFDKESDEGKHVSLELKVVTVWPKWTESQVARLIRLIFTLFDNAPDSRLSCVHSTEVIFYRLCYHTSSLFTKCTPTQHHKVLLN